MREIVLPVDRLQMWLQGQWAGTHIVIPVKVDWPELQLTEEQMLANVMATLDGEPEPYPDHSFFTITLPHPLLVEQYRAPERAVRSSSTSSDPEHAP